MKDKVKRKIYLQNVFYDTKNSSKEICFAFQSPTFNLQHLSIYGHGPKIKTRKVPHTYIYLLDFILLLEWFLEIKYNFLFWKGGTISLTWGLFLYLCSMIVVGRLSMG